MKCHDPVLCYTSPKGKKFYRHWSLASPIIKSSHQLVFNCGKCLTCRKKRSAELAIRCVLHASTRTHNSFLTLTYDESRTGYHNTLKYKEIQDFKKRLRSHLQYHYKITVEIFNVHEYGKNGKKHWHLLLFGYDFPDKSLYTRKNNNNLFTSKELTDLWTHGFSTIGDITEASAMYQAQYTQKDFINGNITNGKQSKSNHSALGKPFFLKHYKQILSLGYIPFNNRKIPLPRYFEKIAHRQYSHFYEPSNFFDNHERKRLYAPIKLGQENKEIADLYLEYKKQKQEKILILEKEWTEYISQFTFNKHETDFQKSGNNLHYDLKNKGQKDIF